MSQGRCGAEFVSTGEVFGAGDGISGNGRRMTNGGLATGSLAGAWDLGANRSRSLLWQAGSLPHGEGGKQAGGISANVLKDSGAGLGGCIGDAADDSGADDKAVGDGGEELDV